ncbi:MAG: cell division protein FtsA [Candidatus Bipolaricaulota bacterium]|nr:cell division protein FtsA [Candidatus Bipolaricaulota bacterium]MBS3791690.1 cell division protein FtsA [Candidatus Bipolaricaulota bacterium]
MESEDLVVGLDIGTTKIVALVGNVVDDSIEIVGIGQAPSKGLEKGVVVDIGQTTSSIRKAVSQAEKMADVKIDSVYAGITGKHINYLNNTGTVSINRSDSVIRKDDVRRVIETAKAMQQIPPQSEMIHIIPRQFVVDNQEGITDPIGMTGTRLEADVHIVTGASTAVHNLTRCLNSLDIGIEQMVLEPLASSHAVLSSAEKQLGVLLMDIGGGTTDLAVFKKGDIWFSKVLPVAGEHMTNDITVGLQTPLEIAEEIKVEHGTVFINEENQDKRIEVATVGGDEVKQIPIKNLAKVIEPRVEEIFNLTFQELEDAGYRDLIPSGVVLTGGTSLLNGIVEYGNRHFDVPIRRGSTPDDIHGLRDVVESPIYATSVGLLKYSVESHDYLRNGKRKMSQGGSVISDIFSWLGKFFRS